ncbi:MAG TPA: arginine repressor [Clostridia bacterium]
MNISKNERQAHILSLIKDQSICTQDDLVTALQKQGFEITQATISRDIKELGIIKISSGNGNQRYVPMERSGEIAAGRLMKVFSEAVISCENAGNMVVIKTLPGMAQASASALDSMRLLDVVGSIAGDDTVFVVTKKASQASSLSESIRQILGNGHA